jgi:hypothetical protein
VRAPSENEGFSRILSYIRGIMSSAEQQRFDDQVLVRYLLGTLPEEEAERFDGLSIADDAFAWQLNAVEDDLVDGYVRGELFGENLARFKEFYLTSPKRIQKLEFAEALSSFGAKTATAAAQAVPAMTVPGSKPKQESSRDLPARRWFSPPHFVPQWGFTGGALVLLFAAGYLLLDNVRLRRQTTVAQGLHAAFDQHEQELQRQLNDERATYAALAKELDSLRESQPNLDHLKTVSALLPPPTRGAGRVPTVSLAGGTELVVLLLTLESDDFPAYRISLNDSATNQIVWLSANLEAASGNSNKIVAVSFPAHLLKQRNYVLELSGVSSKEGRAELIGGYPIRVAIK